MKDANFDCYCGYDENEEINSRLEDNDLWDCIYLCRNLEYRNLFTQLVDMWKEETKQWNSGTYSSLIGFNTYLGKEQENGILYQKLLACAKETDDTFQIVSAYHDLIRWNLKQRDYVNATSMIEQVIGMGHTETKSSVERLRVFGDILEDALELIVEYKDCPKYIWIWTKGKLRTYDNKYGDLYKKEIEAAEVMKDSIQGEYRKEYSKWKEKVQI